MHLQYSDGISHSMNQLLGVSSFWYVNNRFWSCDLYFCSGPVMTLNTKWCSVMNLFHWIHFGLGAHVISSLSFSNFYFENLSVEMTRSSGPNYRDGSCPIFFWSWTEEPEDLSFLHFHFQFLFWKMTWHFGYTLNIGDINIWRHLLKSISI